MNENKEKAGFILKNAKLIVDTRNLFGKAGIKSNKVFKAQGGKGGRREGCKSAGLQVWMSAGMQGWIIGGS